MTLHKIKSASYIGSLLIIGLCFYYSFINAPGTYETIVYSSLAQIAIFIYGYYGLGRIGKSMISAYLLFMVLFYLFQNGQIILYAIGISFDTFYIEKYDLELLLKVIVFSTLCLIMAFVAGVFSIPERTKTQFISSVNNFREKSVLAVAKKGCLITSTIAFPIMFVKFYICATSGYFAVIEFAENTPSIVKVIEKLFLGFCILVLVYAKPKSTPQKMTSCLLIVWSLLAVFSGDRTVGLAGITTLAFYNFKSASDKNIGKNMLTLLGAGVAVIYLIGIAFSFRMQQSTEVQGISGTIIDAVSQLGFSFFPLVLTMDICPSIHNYVYGKSLIGGLVSGLIPNNFDPLGIFDVFSEWSSEPAGWIESDFDYNFGIDFSLTAECYANFGWWGWIAMFFLCSIVAKLLKNLDFKRRDNLYDQYTCLVLLYSWFTLPRRKSYYIYNNWFWYVLAVTIILYLAISKTNRQNKCQNR